MHKKYENFSVKVTACTENICFRYFVSKQDSQFVFTTYLFTYLLSAIKFLL
jgi:hypothetical protein